MDSIEKKKENPLYDVQPNSVRDYVISKGWKKVETKSTEYYLFNHPSIELIQILIPKNPEESDYSRQITDVLLRLGDQEKRSVVLILWDILADYS